MIKRNIDIEVYISMSNHIAPFLAKPERLNKTNDPNILTHIIKVPFTFLIDLI